MISHKIFDVDLHRVENKKLFMLESPANNEFLPSIVSSIAPNKFLTIRRLHPGNFIRSGIFEYDSDRLDEILSPLFKHAYELSLSENFSNIHKTFSEAHDYIKKYSSVKGYPAYCLVPDGFDVSKIENVTIPSYTSEEKNLSSLPIYSDNCKIVHCSVDRPVFLSKPDYVGLLTSFMGRSYSLLMHNVELGVSFVDEIS